MMRNQPMATLNEGVNLEVSIGGFLKGGEELLLKDLM